MQNFFDQFDCDSLLNRTGSGISCQELSLDVRQSLLNKFDEILCEKGFANSCDSFLQEICDQLPDLALREKNTPFRMTKADKSRWIDRKDSCLVNFIVCALLTRLHQLRDNFNRWWNTHSEEVQFVVSSYLKNHPIEGKTCWDQWWDQNAVSLLEYTRQRLYEVDRLRKVHQRILNLINARFSGEQDDRDTQWTIESVGELSRELTTTIASLLDQRQSELFLGQCEVNFSMLRQAATETTMEQYLDQLAKQFLRVLRLLVYQLPEDSSAASQLIEKWKDYWEGPLLERLKAIASDQVPLSSAERAKLETWGQQFVPALHRYVRTRLRRLTRTQEPTSTSAVSQSILVSLMQNHADEVDWEDESSVWRILFGSAGRRFLRDQIEGHDDSEKRDMGGVARKHVETHNRPFQGRHRIQRSLAELQGDTSDEDAASPINLEDTGTPLPEEDAFVNEMAMHLGLLGIDVGLDVAQKLAQHSGVLRIFGRLNEQQKTVFNCKLLSAKDVEIAQLLAIARTEVQQIWDSIIHEAQGLDD